MCNERKRHVLSTANNEWHQVSPSKVTWYEIIHHFVVFSNNVEGHYEQIGAGHLYDSRYQEAYLKRCGLIC
jgi:hypothetical protein